MEVNIFVLRMNGVRVPVFAYGAVSVIWPNINDLKYKRNCFVLEIEVLDYASMLASLHLKQKNQQYMNRNQQCFACTKVLQPVNLRAFVA